MTALTFQDIGLKPAELRAVEKKAKNVGTTAPEFVRALIQRELLADQSFDEILRPVREDFRKSGMTEEQFDQLIERARNAVYRKPRRKRR